MEDLELKRMVEEDIQFLKEQWNRFSADKEQLEAVFSRLYMRYSEKIEQFVKGLRVLSPYDDPHEFTWMYRNNIQIMGKRLEAFRENGYKNEGLAALYNKEGVFEKEAFIRVLNEARYHIQELETVSKREKDLVFEKIDAIEKIYDMPITKAEKWDMLRPYVLWASGKRLEIAREILPLLSQL